MKKRIFSVLTAVSLAAVLCCSVFLSYTAAGEQTERTVYAAFGDSIAAGYGLEGYSEEQTDAPAASYQALVADFLNTSQHNYAVSGDNSDDCIGILDSGKADAVLADADVITISIGSNDLLLPFVQIVQDSIRIDEDDLAKYFPADGSGAKMPDRSEMMALYLKYSAQIATLMEELKDSATLHAKAQAFSGKFQKILDTLHEKAPDAEIYATNIYNPMADVPLIGDLSTQYIEEINRAFSKDADDYTLVDVYTPFLSENLTNVNLDLADPSGMNPDPHPSVKGHKKIAELITEALKDNHAPSKASIKSVKSSKKTKLTLQAKLPENADGYQICFATSKDGAYKALANATSATFRTDSKKLKSGRTYYVKIQSYKKLKGVTYYGKESGAKKITIK